MVVEYKHTNRYSQTHTGCCLQTHPALSVLLLSIYYLLLLMLFWVVAMVSLLCLFFLPFLFQQVIKQIQCLFSLLLLTQLPNFSSSFCPTVLLLIVIT